MSWFRLRGAVGGGGSVPALPGWRGWGPRGGGLALSESSWPSFGFGRSSGGLLFAPCPTYCQLFSSSASGGLYLFRRAECWV